MKLMSLGDYSDEESRTVTLGSKRTSATCQHRSSKKLTNRKRAGRQDLRDFVPRGGDFGRLPLAESDPSSNSLYDTGRWSDVSESSSDYQIPQSHPLKPAMNWNNSSQGSIRTSLRGGGDLGHNRLATGFRSQSELMSNGQARQHDIVEISDDSELEDDSEGGILLNVDPPSRGDSSFRADSPIKISEDQEMVGNDLKKTVPSIRDAKAGKQITTQAAQQSATRSMSSQKPAVTPMFQIDARRGASILADLDPAELENQIKYTLFHLPRDQIDLSRPVICLACLSEGHTDRYCPGLFCSTCGGREKHFSRICPNRTRCSKCGDPGHNRENCKSKLRNPDLKPCDFCGGTDHVEASCIQRFFPARTERPQGELQLWISCAQCGSKEHLTGDCPTYGAKAAPEWSLRSYNRNKIVNLSLQTGAQSREKEAQSKGIRPEGMQIKGRGAPSSNRYPQRGDPAQSDGDDDFTNRIAGNRLRRSSPLRNHIRFDDDDRGRMDRGREDDYYRPRPNRSGPLNDYNNYRPPSSHEYRDRNGYGSRSYQDDRDYHDRRPRSRSPSRFDGDPWRPPPLPRGPPPSVSLATRPAPPRHQHQTQNQNQSTSSNAKRGGAKGKNGRGGKAIKPMPPAAKSAWKRGRP